MTTIASEIKDPSLVISQPSTSALLPSPSHPILSRSTSVNLSQSYLNCNPSTETINTQSSNSTSSLFADGDLLQDYEVEKKYKFGRTLGQGTFATVKLVQSIEDGSQWAIKIIKRSALTSDDEESLKMEIQILQLTNHPNIVNVKEVFYCRNYVYLVMDLMTGGELFDRIVSKDHYNEQEAKETLKQIVVAIKYCHENNIVHRDLKPENILYQSPNDDSIIKIADFGLATMLKSNQLLTVACGTPGYVAPEVLKGLAYGKEVDMWSIGVILYILLCGFPPFYDDNNKKLFLQISNANYCFPDPYWTNVSNSAKDLIRNLLVVDPTKRLTPDQVLQHPWMFEDGSTSNLDHFKANLKSYNARRRFRGAIRAVQLTQLLKKMAKNRQNRPQNDKMSTLIEALDEGDHSTEEKNCSITVEEVAKVAARLNELSIPFTSPSLPTC